MDITVNVESLLVAGVVAATIFQVGKVKGLPTWLQRGLGLGGGGAVGLLPFLGGGDLGHAVLTGFVASGVYAVAYQGTKLGSALELGAFAGLAKFASRALARLGQALGNEDPS